MAETLPPTSESTATSALDLFHPVVRDWFASRFTDPTPAQRGAWPAIRAKRHTLVAAPTGSGKTLAAFLAALDDLLRQGIEGTLRDETQVVYVSPLKALSADIQKNLQEPLAGIEAGLAAAGLPAAPIRTLVRTGDTPAAERARMTKKPPHIVVTTPESLYILLTSEGGRAMLRTTRTVIVDEIHAMVADKRGSHLSLSLERLEALAGEGLVRVGLSATQRPIEEVGRFLVGAGRVLADGAPDCTIVDEGHVRGLDLAIEVPRSPLSAVMSHEVWAEVYDRLADLIRVHRTTIVFVNTRRLAERAARFLSERLGEDRVTSHHGSLAKEQRLRAEQRLKAGELQALVATASLELGIDIGAVDLVCQLGSTRTIATLLQRVGRSGHSVGGHPKGRIFPLTRDELVESAALLDAVRRGELDRLHVPDQPLDLLAQQIVAMVACEEWREDDLYALVRRAWPYRSLPRETFEEVVRMVAEGFATKRGRRSAWIHRDAVNGRLRGRRGARLSAITSGGAIPENADYAVVLEPAGAVIGTVNEDFAVESLAGDIFQLGNASWRILRVEAGKVRVEDARGQPPTIPFWIGEAPARSRELSEAVSRLRVDVEARIGAVEPDTVPSGPSDERPRELAQGLAVTTTLDAATLDPATAAIAEYLSGTIGVAPEAALQVAEYLASARAALGVMPSRETLVLERFFDDSGGMQLVVHSPFGSRINRAFGLALRKRFCVKFNFELQAAATEDAIVISLGQQHSFPLEEVFRYLRSTTVREVLKVALLDAPMFGIRWRWAATRSLAIPRWRSGKKVPPPLQRMESEDLLAAVFPDQLACLQDKGGPREVPDHPLVNQAIHDCLFEVMDVAGLEELLASMERGEKRLVARDLREPSPLAHEILTARPYAFLDDAPLEERRTQAVQTRRWIDPATAEDLGTLDAAAIERVREESWPNVRDADELHEALVQMGFLSPEEARAAESVLADVPQDAASDRAARSAPGSSMEAWLQVLIEDRRASVLRAPGGTGALWIAAERLEEIRAVFPQAVMDPPIAPPPSVRRSEPPSAEEALAELLRGRLDSTGPSTASALALLSGLPTSQIDAALLRLEGEGFVLRGRFTPGADETEWCARRLLARIHRYTLERLRREIEPVTSADFMRFLIERHHLAADARVEGPQSLARLVELLEGFEAPAAAWEGEILPARMQDYDPQWLDALCLSGKLVWARTRVAESAPASAPSRTSARENHRASTKLVPRGLTAPVPDARTLSDGSSPSSSAAAPRVRRGAGPVRSTPIRLLSRRHLGPWTGANDRPIPAELSAAGGEVLSSLTHRGASFFEDLVESTRLLRPQVEDALAELVAFGLVTSDGFSGLRALLTPSEKRPSSPSGRRRRSAAIFGMESAGRWTLLRPAATVSSPAGHDGAASPPRDARGPAARHSDEAASAIETIARALLGRWGVVFRALLVREGDLPPWRDLLRAYRRLEARGEIRGGRFVDGFTGEQFALPEAVASLRAVRRRERSGTLVAVSGADPLNLTGIALPGERLPALSGNRVLYRDGVPIAVRERGEVRMLAELDPAAAWEARNALLQRRIPPKLRLYLGRSA